MCQHSLSNRNSKRGEKKTKPPRLVFSRSKPRNLVPPRKSIHEPSGWALEGQVPSSTAIMTYSHRDTISTHMAHLLTVPTNYIPEPTSASASASTKSTTSLSVSIFDHISLWTVSSHVTRNIAHVAHGLILTVACKMARLPTVLACLVVGAVSCHVSLLEAIVAQPQVARWQLRSRAVSGTVPCLPTSVADALIWAVSCHVTRLPTVPAQRFCGAF